MSMATETLEREVEATRDRVERTVDAIKDKMSVGQILDDVVRYTARHGGSDMANNLGRQIKENPLPLALVGVGLAWLVMGKGQARDSYADYGGYADEWGESSYRPGIGAKVRGAARGAGSAIHAAASGVSAAAHGIAGAAQSVGEAVGSAVQGLASAGPKVGDMAQGTADDLRHRASDAAGMAREGMDHAGQYAQRTTRAVGDFLREEPLLAGAIGIAIGATIGALLPATEVEDQLFGDTRDRLADEAERIAGEQFEKVKEAAGEAYETVKTEAETRLAEMTGDGDQRQTGTL